MEPGDQPRPWHPFRLPGLCGLRGTTIILLLLTLVIVLPILYYDRGQPGKDSPQTPQPRPNTTAYSTDEREAPPTNSARGQHGSLHGLILLAGLPQADGYRMIILAGLTLTLSLTVHATHNVEVPQDLPGVVSPDPATPAHEFAVKEGQWAEFDIPGTEWYSYYGMTYPTYICTSPCEYNSEMFFHTLSLDPYPPLSDPTPTYKPGDWIDKGGWTGFETMTRPRRRFRDRVALKQDSTHVKVIWKQPLTSDQGNYHLCIDKIGYDPCYIFHLTVIPKPHPTETSLAGRIESYPTDTVIEQWLNPGYNSDVPQRTCSQVHDILLRCQNNVACTVAVMHKISYGYEEPCWVCQHTHHSFSVEPLYPIDVANQTDQNDTCRFPRTMINLLLMNKAALSNSTTPETTNCTDRTGTWATQHLVTVRPTHAPVCLCQFQMTNQTPLLGWSSCALNVHVSPETHPNCSYRVGDHVANLTCPFLAEHLPHDYPGMMWVCGRNAYHLLPAAWSGCCYPAALRPDHDIYPSQGEPLHPTEPPAQTTRRRRSTALDEMKTAFPTYRFVDPWTSPSATVGYSLLSPVGLVWSLQKINYLAGQLLQLVNATHDVQEAITSNAAEMRAIRSVVLQNRLVLDILTAQSGGVCRKLNTKCCFHIADNWQNISDLMAHSRASIASIQPPASAPSESPWDWLTRWGQGWMTWVCTLVLPVLIPIFVIIFVGLPVLQCCLNRAMSATFRPSTTNESLFRETAPFSNLDDGELREVFATPPQADARVCVCVTCNQMLP